MCPVTLLLLLAVPAAAEPNTEADNHLVRRI
jgi:hypothetical protein